LDQDGNVGWLCDTRREENQPSGPTNLHTTFAFRLARSPISQLIEFASPHRISNARNEMSLGAVVALHERFPHHRFPPEYPAGAYHLQAAFAVYNLQ
jgi:hypothetical protein